MLNQVEVIEISEVEWEASLELYLALRILRHFYKSQNDFSRLSCKATPEGEGPEARETASFDKRY